MKNRKKQVKLPGYEDETMQKDREKQQLYEEYVKKVTPTHSLPANMVKAFLVGGLICVSGQAVTEWALAAGMDEKTAGTWCSIALIFLSALTTGMNLYPRLAKWGGAGTLVPITGFANSVAAPAVEYQKEGQVFGIGSKIFTIAGPVILYGVLTSWALGLIQYVAERW